MTATRAPLAALLLVALAALLWSPRFSLEVHVVVQPVAVRVLA